MSAGKQLANYLYRAVPCGDFNEIVIRDRDTGHSAKPVEWYTVSVGRGQLVIEIELPKQNEK